jgi:DNA-directed RNA polymerase sigma subunit (sigma70/sigma32)
MNKEVKRKWWQLHRGKQQPRRQKFVDSIKDIGALEEKLTQEEQLLIEYYFGLNGEFKSLAYIGRECFTPPLDRHQVHAIKESALKKLNLDPNEFRNL